MSASEFAVITAWGDLQQARETLSMARTSRDKRHLKLIYRNYLKNGTLNFNARPQLLSANLCGAAFQVVVPVGCMEFAAPTSHTVCHNVHTMWTTLWSLRGGWLADLSVALFDNGINWRHISPFFSSPFHFISTALMACCRQCGGLSACVAISHTHTESLGEIVCRDAPDWLHYRSVIRMELNLDNKFSCLIRCFLVMLH